MGAVLLLLFGCAAEEDNEIPASTDVGAHVCNELIELSDILHDAEATPTEQGETGPRLVAVAVLAEEAARRDSTYERLSEEIDSVQDALRRRDGEAMAEHMAAAEAQCYLVGRVDP